MHHKRKQKFSLIVKPWQQSQANDRNLMITDRITLPDAVLKFFENAKRADILKESVLNFEVLANLMGLNPVFIFIDGWKNLSEWLVFI